MKNGISWEMLVGYSAAQLKARLEETFAPGMFWSNYGEWHIDHIRPICLFTFNSTSDPQFKACWALWNLRALWATSNMALGARAREEKRLTLS